MSCSALYRSCGREGPHAPTCRSCRSSPRAGAARRAAAVEPRRDGSRFSARTLRKPNGGPRRYYLIELDPAAVRTKKASQQNMRASGAVVYVGSIGRSDERTASHVVKRFGRRYLGEILEPTGEREIAAFLRQQGYTVVQS